MSNFFSQCDLTAGYTLPCKFLPKAGTQDELILINWNRIEKSFPKSTVNEKVITDIVQKFGGEGFLIQGKNNSIEASANAEQGTFFPNQGQSVIFRTFGDNPIIAKFKDEMKFGRFLAVMQDANGWYKVFGADGGLILTSSTQTTTDEDTGGGSVIELIGDKEKSEPLFLAVDYVQTDPTSPSYNKASTDTLFKALVNPVTLAISGVSASTAPVITVASTDGIFDGDIILVKNITWTTDPTDPLSVLNDGKFFVEVIDATTMRITASADTPTKPFNTTGGVYGSAGTIQRGY